MRFRLASLGLFPLLGAAAGCTAWHAQALPTPLSRDVHGTGRLRAGAARVDITPPPGVGLAGSGPEGRRSTGYRTRLYAGALVLEDPTGERIALVVVDLAHVSANLHRLVADRLLPTTGIGADRLIISATHTHSGPGHFYAERQYNSMAARVPGYDPRMVDFLVSRIALAVHRAVDSLGPAVAAVGEAAVPGATFNRSFGAYCLNPGIEVETICAAHDSTAAVDPTLFMLRVDRTEPSGGTSPLASYSVFALHGTAIPNLNTLLDGDSHVRIVARLAAHADRSSPRATVHLFANGAEGDVAPLVGGRDLCDLPRLGMLDPVPLPRGPVAAVEFLEPAADRVERCLDTALDQIEREADRVATPAIALYDSLGHRLRGDLSIRRAFTTVPLAGNDGLCRSPVIGSSAAAGAEQLETRVRGWRWLMWPVFKIALEEGGAAVDSVPGACQSPKRTLLGPIQALFVVGDHGFPDVAQLTVVRIGPALLAAAPVEVTTMAWRQMRQAMAGGAPDPAHPVVLVGLADGFLQYVTTAEEYQWQAYEGGSDLYGPGTALFLARRLAELTRRITGAGSGPSPPATVGPITAYPGPPSAIMPSADVGPATYSPSPITAECRLGRVTAEWLDLAPGRVFPRDVPWIVLERESAPHGWEPMAADGDGRLEVQAVKDRGRRGFLWRARWRAPTPEGSYRFVRLDLDGTRRVLSQPFRCGAQGSSATAP